VAFFFFFFFFFFLHFWTQTTFFFFFFSAMKNSFCWGLALTAATAACHAASLDELLSRGIDTSAAASAAAAAPTVLGSNAGASKPASTTAEPIVSATSSHAAAARPSGGDVTPPRATVTLPSAADAAARMLAGWPVVIGKSSLAGHGLFSTRAIANGERMLCTPHDKTFTRKFIFDAGLSALSAHRDARNLTAMDQMSLAVARLMYDTGADPWLAEKYGDAAATWPRNLSYVGATMYSGSADPDEDLSDIPRLPFHQREYVDAWYWARVRPVIEAYPAYFGSPVREAYDLEHFVHARQTIGSRGYGAAAFGFGLAPEEEGYGLLIPGLDLFNHPPSRTLYEHSTIAPTREHGHCIYALRDYAAGEEIFSSYGTRDTHTRVFTYGFRGDVAPETDYVPVTVKLRDSYSFFFFFFFFGTS
jgi:hypothetical protein